MSQWCHPTISSSVVPFSSCCQSFPTSGSWLMSQLFASGGQSIGVSALASVLAMNIQDWCTFHLKFTRVSELYSFRRVHNGSRDFLSHRWGAGLLLWKRCMHYQDFDKSLPLNCYSVAFWPEFILASGEMTVCSDILLCSNRVLPSDLKIFHYLFLLSWRWYHWRDWFISWALMRERNICLNMCFSMVGQFKHTTCSLRKFREKHQNILE